ncbi:MAG TPA: hypothetical protein VLE22_25020 [Bryobacteraceae bacterium]|nr:hypothetical protein [Bryobacteraceae bacterium]
MRTVKLFALAFLLLAAGRSQDRQDWTHFVRIGGHGVSLSNVDQIVRSATDTFVFGIEVDNDIPGRYESFLDPTEKLTALRAVAAKAHEAGNYAFVYIAGTECITAKAASQAHSMAKDHPDWLQRKITGEPAVFGGGAAFWVREGDEDVWLTPFATDWMKTYLERVRQIAATGIDGVYVDIPYWMTHFKGWGDSWVSFDDYTVAAFKRKTGLNAKTDLKLGDFRDANFRKWIDFRIDALTDFMRQIDAAVKSVNPKCKTIAEIYPGIEDPAVRVGTDVYDLYRVVDTIAHEYSTGGRAARRTPLTWFQDMVGMYSFRAFAGSKPTWMLTYSWENEKEIVPGEAMKNLATAQLMAGTNTWDARGHVMSGSNDIETRKVIFQWIRDHEKVFFLPRMPIRPIGVYFSPKSRNYFSKEFIDSYRGTMMLLMQSHLEFQVVTPRTLDAFHGSVLILPEARCLGKQELDVLRSRFNSGMTLIVTGETGKYDDTGAEQPANPIHKLLGIADPAQEGAGTSRRKFLYYPRCPGAEYYAQLRKEFNELAASGEYQQAQFERLRTAWAAKLLGMSQIKPAVEVETSPFISTQIAQVDGKTRVFLANFKGLKASQVAQQLPERNVRITFKTGRKGSVYVLPFLGEVEKLAGEWKNGSLTCVIPEVNKGAVVWLD